MVELIGKMLMNAVETSGKTSGIGILIALTVALYAGGNGAGAIMQLKMRWPIAGADGVRLIRCWSVQFWPSSTGSAR